VKPPPFDYACPDEIREAAALLAGDSEAKVLAGGQSLIPLLNFRLATPSRLVDLRRVPDLDRIVRDDGRVRLGAMVRQRQAERSALLAEACPLLLAALRFVGHPQIRSRGTVGGSIAHADPAAELPAVLIALDGRVRAVGPGTERWIAGAELYETYFTTSLAHDEILAELELPAALPRTGAACIEVARRAGDYALCGAAAQVSLGEDGTLADARVGLFGVGGRPERAHSTEQLLRGELPHPELVAAAAAPASDNLSPADDVQATADFRRHLARVVTRRALERALSRASASAS
jgi:aerobic carbon-monoxide dehydrogenase medium subunit